MTVNARLRIVAIGNRMPGWVQAGFEEYRKRLPRDFALELRELALARRGEAPVRGIEAEGQDLLGALPPDALVVALAGGGQHSHPRHAAP